MIYPYDRYRAAGYNYHLAGVMKLNRFLLAASLTLLLLYSCKQQADIQADYLFGKWDIWQAQRNGRDTPYLRGGYMIIDRNGTMTVNLTGSEEKGSFKLDDNTLLGPMGNKYQILSIQKDSMRIQFNKSEDSEFLIFLHKNNDAAN